jgi:hypothetical protein
MMIWHFNATIKWLENELDLTIVITTCNDYFVMTWIMKS